MSLNHWGDKLTFTAKPERNIMLKKLSIYMFLISIGFGLPLQVGDVVPDFSVPICANPGDDPDGFFRFYTYNGNTNPTGEFSVIWLNLFTSW